MSSFKKALLILNSDQKKYLIFLFILMMISTALETLSVGVMVPLFSILLKGEANLGFIPNIIPFEISSGKSLLYIGLSIAAIVYVIKNIFLVFSHWYQSKFLERIWVELSDKLFKDYLKKDYIFFLQTNTTQLIRNIRGEIPSFIEFLNKFLIFFNEIIVFFGIVFLLFYIDFFGTALILFFVTVFASVIHIFTKRRIDLYGKERISLEGKYEKHLAQGLSSAKDVKILNREEDLIHQFYKSLFKLSKIGLFSKFLSGLPKYLFEILIVFIFIILILSMFAIGRDMVGIIQYLGIFAIASFRIVPAASRIFTSFQSIKFREPTVNHLVKEVSFEKKFNRKFNLQEKNQTGDIKYKDSIKIKNLSFSYPVRKKEFSLSNISLTIKKGDFVGIIGETGSGKSTLINLLTGLLKPSEGKIEVDDLSIYSNVKKWHKKIGYVPQSVYLTDETIRKNIAFGLLDSNIDEDQVNQAVDKASLNEFIKNLPNGLNTIVGENGIQVSGGQQQRIAIARALYQDPEILILDEATSSLDIITEKKIMDSVNFLKRKKTLIVITHRLSTVEKCDRVFFINKGKIIKEGSPNEVLEKFKNE